MSTKKTTENKFVELPRGFPKIPRGYVPLGFGARFQKPGDFKLFAGGVAEQNDKTWRFEDHLSGDGSSLFYIVPSNSEIANLNYPWLAATDPEPIKWVERKHGEAVISTNNADESDEYTGSSTLDAQSEDTEARPKCAYMWYNTWITVLPSSKRRVGESVSVNGKRYFIRARFLAPEWKAWKARQDAKAKPEPTTVREFPEPIKWAERATGETVQESDEVSNGLKAFDLQADSYDKGDFDKGWTKNHGWYGAIVGTDYNFPSGALIIRARYLTPEWKAWNERQKIKETGKTRRETTTERDARLKATYESYRKAGGPITEEQLTDEMREWCEKNEIECFCSLDPEGLSSRYFILPVAYLDKKNNGGSYPSLENIRNGVVFWTYEGAKREHGGQVSRDSKRLEWLQDRKNWERVMLESEFSSGNLRKAIDNARVRWQRS